MHWQGDQSRSCLWPIRDLWVSESPACLLGDATGIQALKEVVDLPGSLRVSPNRQGIFLERMLLYITLRLRIGRWKASGWFKCRIAVMNCWQCDENDSTQLPR